jgi:ParB/RepB/Spo0J family partition protein
VIPIVKRHVCEVATGLLDPPDIPMRDDMNTPAYAELRESILQNGVQVALIVERRGERFKISAGHRRYCVGVELGAATLPCDIREPGEIDAEAIKVLENDDREKVNPAEAAYYLARLWLERCDKDVDKLCTLIRKGRPYVESRLSLLEGDAEVLDAVKQRRIGLGVAVELNKIVHVGYRRMNLERALTDGLTETAARRERRHANFATAKGDVVPVAAPPVVELAPSVSQQQCRACLGHDAPERFRWILVHDFCDMAIIEPALVRWRAAMRIADGDSQT